MHEYHVTLKQLCLIDTNDIQQIKDTLTRFFHSYEIPARTLAIIFDTLVIESESDGTMTIMVNAKENPAIQKLQKDILHLFPRDARYRYPESREWERNFKPHVTIAADLNQIVYEDAQKEIGEDVRCEGYIDAVTLEIASENDGNRILVDRIEFCF